MPTARVLSTTVTRKVRDFLVRHHISLPPWSGFTETYDTLYALMSRHRRDPGFWEPLDGLLLCCERDDGALSRTYGESTETGLIASSLCQEPIFIYMAAPFFKK